MDVNIKNGADGKIASVSSTNRLNVSAKTNPRIFYSSRDDGQAFNAISLGANDYAAGEFGFYIKNTSTTRNMFIKHIEFHSVDAARYLISPSNLNLGSGLSAETTCMGGGAAITGLTTTKLIGTHRTTALSESEMSYLNALILTPNSAIAIEYDAEYGGTTGIMEIDCFFHFENIGAK